ncbi:MAG: rod shape-determining protein MreD [Candidatus Cloacimonadaceae bacterium]|jgi:rod shape-determining protein MreD|nr:rod shape-determining protein MreD [Candidatus Cloacimonadota bacterium]MDX9949295.1 rod shape-determining protein MreD [Candidatus Syntrophosphaera sp.]NLN85478.1 rod shape-determining protein MreD [Candidatus Cloacimonadota bacterium]
MALKHIWTFILGLIFFYVQVLFMPAFELFGVIPNILIPWTVYLVWTRELNPSLIVIFIIGLLYDTTSPQTFGSHALIFLIVGMAINQFRKPFEDESVLARMISLVLANLIFHFIFWLTLGIDYGFNSQLFSLNLIAFAYNLAISFVVFWITQLVSRLRIVLVHD